MDTETPDPGLAVGPAAAACPHCGGGCGGVANPTALHCAALTEMIGIGLTIARLVGKRVEEMGYLAHEDAIGLEIVSRATRRTIALHKRVYEDSRKTPEQLAAERAARAAAAGQAPPRERPEPGWPTAEAIANSEPGPSDRENLLSDMHERLLPAGAEIALLPEDVSAVMLGTLKELEIVPKRETWSDALMAHEISATHAEMKQIEAGRTAPAPDVDWREGVEFSKPPDGVTKIGRFTFGPGGVLLHQDPPERPESEWPPDILERPLPDLLRGRKPPGTG
jgi:hypothetical protein